jgi:VWFA-related protein
VVAVLALLAVPLHAQISESVEVHVLEVEATVVDRNGKTVSDLTQADFAVEVAGKPAEITNFFAVRRGVVDDNDPSTPERVIPSRISIFVDDMHLHPVAKANAMKALRQYIENKLDPNATTALVRWSGSLKMIVPPTRDKAKLLAGVKEMSKDPGRLADLEHDIEFLTLIAEVQDVNAFPDYMRMLSVQSSHTMEGLTEIVQSMAGLTGRRTVLFIGQGLPVARRVALDGLIASAQKAGVMISALDPTVGHEERSNATDALQYFARETGGKLVRNQNDLGRALDAITEEASTYYSLGVRAPSAGNAVDVVVKLRNRPELRVVTAGKRGVPSAEERLASSVRSRLYSREQENPLKVMVALVPPRKQQDRCVLTFQIGVPASELTLIPTGEASKGELAVRYAILDNADGESNVQSTVKEVWPLPKEIVRETVSFGVQAGRRYVLSVAVTDGVSQETSYLQTEVDAGGCR